MGKLTLRRDGTKAWVLSDPATGQDVGGVTYTPRGRRESLQTVALRRKRAACYWRSCAAVGNGGEGRRVCDCEIWQIMTYSSVAGARLVERDWSRL